MLTRPIWTWADIEDATRDLAASIAAHQAETDPAWREALADTIEMDRQFLAEMLASVSPPLPLVLPIGLPAPRPQQETMQ